MRTGELTLAEFAADLHEVTLARGKRPIYEDPEKFFALTYPTHALRELVKDVSMRLAGQSDKAVRQLELTYGGGKTHTLIALYHLFRDPEALPDVPAVREFREYVGASLPKAFVATLCFDKIDVERGIEGVQAPDGETRTLRHPWSVLAWQLAGAEGLRAIHGDGADAERETPPAEPLLTKLVELPAREGLATLILVDEVLMYGPRKGWSRPGMARAHRRLLPVPDRGGRQGRQCRHSRLPACHGPRQAARRIGREVGERSVRGLSAASERKAFSRYSGRMSPRCCSRRFFDPEGLHDQNAYRAHVIGVVRGLAKLDETTAKNRPEQETRFLESFPFTPELTDVFYSRWTQLDRFPAYPGNPAYAGDCIARSRALGRQSGNRSGDALGRTGTAGHLRCGEGTGQCCRFRGFGQFVGLGQVARSGTGQGKADTG